MCFFMQKTANDRRIVGWSSDVGSSDLMYRTGVVEPATLVNIGLKDDPQHLLLAASGIGRGKARGLAHRHAIGFPAHRLPHIAGGQSIAVRRVRRDERKRPVVDRRTRRADAVGRRAGKADRKSVVEGTRVSVSEESGGGRSIKKKK